MREPRLQLKNGYEYDALTGWKKYCFWQSGVRKKIKRGYRKRVRASWRSKIRERL